MLGVAFNSSLDAFRVFESWLMLKSGTLPLPNAVVVVTVDKATFVVDAAVCVCVCVCVRGRTRISTDEQLFFSFLDLLTNHWRLMHN